MFESIRYPQLTNKKQEVDRLLKIIYTVLTFYFFLRQYNTYSHTRYELSRIAHHQKIMYVHE